MKPTSWPDMPNTRVSGARVGSHPASLAFEASRSGAAPLTDLLVRRVVGKRGKLDKMIVQTSDGRTLVLHDCPPTLTLGCEYQEEA
jgi:hypothetical protein